MPSNKDPKTVVNPTPGKLAAGEVHASSLAFPLGGGSGDLAAHIADPIDAHFADAIGVRDFYPSTGEPLRASVGGPYDGESVLDALNSLKDLLPVKPDKIGFNAPVPNSGFMTWPLGTVVSGGFTNLGGTGIVTKYLTAQAAGTYNITGMVYPADRGVLAVYQTTADNFFNAGQTTLLAALWLGSNPPPAGIPSADFDPSQKTTIQPAKGSPPGAPGTYTPAGTGLDKIALASRLPYLDDYSSFGNPFSAFDSDFSSYQVAAYSIPITTVSGENGSFLVVHWKEQYATSLAAIQPAGLTALTLTATNAYSAVPADPAINYGNVNRKNVFVDTQPAGPTAGSISTTPTGTVTFSLLSGIRFYNSNGLQFAAQATANDVFENSYFTNTIASVSVPAGFESPQAVASADLTDFGGTVQDYQLYDASPARILDHSTGNPFTLVAPPATTDVARFTHSAQPIGGSGAAAPYPYAQVRVVFRSPFGAPLTMTDSKLYLYNTLAGASTHQSEPFVDEDYRYDASATITSASPMLPSGGSDFDSTAVLVSNDGELQVYSGRLVYPGVDFTIASYDPAQQAGSNYALVAAGDAGSHKRRYVRIFDTQISKNTGTLTISGLSFTAFQASGPIDLNEVTDHPGGAIIQLKIPGVTGWLDLGRAKGDPDLNTAADFRGCRTGISGSSYTFETGGFTAPNGSGEYLLIVRVTFINGTGNSLFIDSITLS